MTVTVSAAAEAVVNGDLVQPRVRITAASSPASGEPLTVWRVHEDGSEWRVILPTGSRLAAGAAVVFDYHAPLNELVRYRAETASQSGPVSEPTVVVSTVSWISTADEPELALPAVYVEDLGDETADFSGATASSVAGTRRKVGNSDRTVGLSGTIQFGIDVARLEAWRALLFRGDALLLMLHQPRWDVQWAWVMPSRVSIKNPGSNEQPKGKAGYPYRLVEVQYDPIDPPDTDLTPLWTDGDAAAAFASDAAMEAAYASDLAHELDARIA